MLNNIIYLLYFIIDDLPETTANANEVTYNIIVASLFLFAWINQFRANITLANLRKDKKSGKINCIHLKQ